MATNAENGNGSGKTTLSALDQKPGSPYGMSKSLRVKIIKVDDWKEYTRTNQKSGHYMKFMVADQTTFKSGIAYDKDTQEAFLKEGTSLLLRNYMFVANQLKLTSNTKIYRCEQIPVPQEIEKAATGSKSRLTVAEIHSSPVKQTVSVEGTITKEEATKDVKTPFGHGQNTSKVRELTITDHTGDAKVSLWNAQADSPVKCGDKIQINDGVVKYSNFHNENTISVNALSNIQVVPKQELKFETAEVQAVAMGKGNDLLLFVEINNIQREMQCDLAIIAEYLQIDVEETNPSQLEETLLAPLLPLSCKLKVNGQKIIAMMKP